ncbi:MAG: S9 family peptidase [Roseateles depolymerans]|uniref:S9 family peptidase n=1 Tax=Roseateles depolymerans TaxID=76731 RepID=A0A2W5E619_9BURK|nr:MAG: S9 family peptidase [Roseateles depolymerans]
MNAPATGRRTLSCLAATLGLALTLGLQATAHSAATPPDAAFFYAEADIREATLSPSGGLLAVTTAKGLERTGIAVFDLHDFSKPLTVKRFTDGDITGVAWVNDERLVFGVNDYSEGSGRPNGAPGLFAMEARNGDIRMLVRRQNRPFITDGSADKRLLDWNHRLLRIPVPRAGAPNDEVLLGEFNTRGEFTEWPVWLNIRTGRTRSLRLNLPEAARGWLTDSQGEPRVALASRDGRQRAYWRRPGSDDWTLIYDSPLDHNPLGMFGVDDAGTLYVTRRHGPAGYTVLTRYDADKRAPEPQPVVSTPGFDFNGRLLLADGVRALGVRVNVDAETTIWFDERLKALQAEADALLPGRVNSIECRRCGADDVVALVRSYNDHDPGQLLLYQARPAGADTRWRRLSAVRSDLKPADMATLALHRIKARDGRDLPVWVTRPDDAKGPRPAVVLVHGGPWVRGTYWRWRADEQFLASRGYVVIAPEMRGSTGYGLAHLRAGFRQFGQAMQDDVTDALKWAQAQGLASDKACIVGSSYGGYSTLMGLIKDPGLYRCGVASFALADLNLYLSGSFWVGDDISADARRYTLPERVGDAEKDAAMIAANSPVLQAARLKAPLLLAFGEDDKRVPLAHGERLRRALIEAGNPPEWVTYPGEGHGFGILANRVDFARRMATFLDQHLGPGVDAH